MAQDATLRRITVSNDDGDVYVESSGDGSEIVLKTEKVRVTDGDVYVGTSNVGLSAQIDALKTKDDVLGERIDTLNDTQIEIRGDLDALETSTSGRLTSIDTTLTSLLSTDASLSATDASLSNRIDALNTTDAQLKSTDETLKTHISSLNVTDAELKGVDDGLSSRIDALRDIYVNELNVTDKQLIVTDAKLGSRIDALNATQYELKGFDAGLSSRIDILESAHVEYDRIDDKVASLIASLNASDDKFRVTDKKIEGHILTLNSTDQELAFKDEELTERIDSLNASQLPHPPTCGYPGGDKLQYNGTHWHCVCTRWWSGPQCDVPPMWSWNQKLLAARAHAAYSRIAIVSAFFTNETFISVSNSEMFTHDLSSMNTSVKGIENTLWTRSPNRIWRTLDHNEYAAFTSLDSPGYASVLKRSENGAWATDLSVAGTATDGTQKYGRSVDMQKLDAQFLFAVIRNDESYKCPDDVSNVDIYIKRIGNGVWTLENTITLSGKRVYSSSASFKYICKKGHQRVKFGNFNDGKYFLAAQHWENLNERYRFTISIYKNVSPTTEGSTWDFVVSRSYDSTWGGNACSIWEGSHLTTCLPLKMSFVGKDSIVVLIGAGERRYADDIEDYSATACTEIRIYDVETFEQIQLIDLPNCVTNGDRVTLSANEHHFIVGDGENKAVYVYGQVSKVSRKFQQIDELSTQRLPTPTPSWRNFGGDVIISANDNVFVWAYNEPSIGARDGVVHRFVRHNPT